MKLKSLMTTLFVLAIVCTAQATMAQEGVVGPAVLVEDAFASTVDATVNVSVEFVEGTTPELAVAQFDILYDSARFTPTMPANCDEPADPDWLCTIFAPGTMRWQADPDFAVEDYPPTDVVFTILNNEEGTFPLTVTNEVYGDAGANPVAPNGTMNGSITIQTEPMPNYNSTPTPGGTIDFGTPVEGSPDPQEVLNIENNGTPGGGVMNVDCDITNNPGGVYSLVSPVDGVFALDIGQNADLTIACDTAIAGDFTGGTLSCDHDAPNAPDPATYTLDCFVSGDPVYGSTPANGDPIAFGSFPQNNPAPSQTLLINNDAGEAGSVLAGDCSLMDGTTPISLAGGPTVPYSVMQGAADAEIVLNCDTTQAEGAYNDTLVCTNNDPVLAADATYPVSCEILPPDPGLWGSNPPSGSTINLTPGGAVPVGTDLTNAGQLEVFNAGNAGDEDIAYTCTLTSTGEITQDPSPAMGTLVADGPSDLINYSCNTDIAGAFTGSVSCIWSAPIEGVNEELYDVTCDVREAASEVVETPPSGTAQTAEVSPGESITFDFNFEEVLDEGLDGSLESCALVTGTDFVITTSTVYPQVIPSGGPPLLVQVEFTDPGQGDTFTDTLNCTYQDNTDGGEPEQTPVSWPLEVSVTGRNATFRVTKDFDDDNPLGVEVFLDCNTGLPLQQNAVIHDPDAVGLEPGDFTHVDFVIADFEPGTLDCDIFETVPAGYAASYFAAVGDEGTANNVFADDEGCHYEGVEGADFVCEITNELQPVDVIVNKEWIDDNPQFQLPTTVEVTLECTDPIIGGFSCGLVSGIEGSQDGNCAQRFIDPGNPGVFEVLPHFDGTSCTATETPEVGVLIDESDCEELLLLPGQGAECTIVNTRLFAGIPTLSQYGLLVMALLMLGVGLIGFRRYA